MKADTFDIVIVGAGIVGLAAAVSLAQTGRRIALVDAAGKPQPTSLIWDQRIYALTPGNRDWLDAQGVWDFVDTSRVCDIVAMHLWNRQAEADSKPVLALNSEDAGMQAMGAIIESEQLTAALWKRLDALNVTVITGVACERLYDGGSQVELSLADGQVLHAPLLLAADGARSFVRKQWQMPMRSKAFGQTALVANYLATEDHAGVARQWFAPHDILALLPLPNRYVSIVWSMSTERAAEMLLMTPAQQTERVEAASYGLLGRLQPVSELLGFELHQETAVNQADRRVVLMGDAAHRVHPMAGQGMNLGLRDVIELTRLIASAHHLQDIGEPVFLRRFERARKQDVMQMNVLTSGLDALFAMQSDRMNKLTDWGMQQVERHGIIKQWLVHRAVA